MGQPNIKSTDPKREWLLRCSDNDTLPAVCPIGVSNGQVEVFDPEGQMIAFNGREIADFRAALNSAIDLAESDLLRQRDHNSKR